MKARKIIVGYDRSCEARAAAAWALDEADRTGALVEFFYAYEWPTWVPAASTVPAPAVWPDGETDRAIKGSLREAVAQARETHPRVPTKVSIVHGSTALTLIERSAEAGLVVLGSRGHSAVAGVLGSVSVAVSAHAHCPVIVVRGETDRAAPVVVGVDDSPCAQLALNFALDQALERHVPVRIIHAWRPVTGIWEDSPLVTHTVTAEERRPFDEIVSAWRDKYPQVKITADAVVDHPAHALAVASATAQLVVVGSRGRGAFRGMVLGSVSQHLLRQSACTVAVVREVSAS
ncbi:universal stress protein [Actinoplanes sp. NPDC049548]|uniref:universal stress protein n=1 Tax=Actinoplanes sp. NPDC049548 TaxID=3155152 RepID=UPI0034148F9A